MAAKCPSCSKLLTSLRFETVTASASFGSGSWHTVIYHCPFCFSAISAQIDPIAVKADTVTDVAKVLAPMQSNLDELADAVNQLARRLR
jgi:hypothetical protein